MTDKRTTWMRFIPLLVILAVSVGILAIAYYANQPPRAVEKAQEQLDFVLHHDHTKQEECDARAVLVETMKIEQINEGYDLAKLELDTCNNEVELQRIQQGLDD